MKRAICGLLILTILISISGCQFIEDCVDNFKAQAKFAAESEPEKYAELYSGILDESDEQTSSSSNSIFSANTEVPFTNGLVVTVGEAYQTTDSMGESCISIDYLIENGGSESINIGANSFHVYGDDYALDIDIFGNNFNVATNLDANRKTTGSICVYGNIMDYSIIEVCLGDTVWRSYENYAQEFVEDNVNQNLNYENQQLEYEESGYDYQENEQDIYFTFDLDNYLQLPNRKAIVEAIENDYGDIFDWDEDFYCYISKDNSVLIENVSGQENTDNDDNIWFEIYESFSADVRINQVGVGTYCDEAIEKIQGLGGTISEINYYMKNGLPCRICCYTDKYYLELYIGQDYVVNTIIGCKL